MDRGAWGRKGSDMTEQLSTETESEGKCPGRSGLTHLRREQAQAEAGLATLEIGPAFRHLCFLSTWPLFSSVLGTPIRLSVHPLASSGNENH